MQCQEAYSTFCENFIFASGLITFVLLILMNPRIKICCIGSIEEAKMAIKYGASAIGLVSEMPSGPGVIPEDLITEIALSVPQSIFTFLLTSKRDTASIIEQQKRCKVNTIQICDSLAEGDYTDFRKELPEIKIIQVIHVVDESSVEQSISIAPLVDGLLLDSGDVNSSVKELGGTGRIHNWNLSRAIVKSTQTPVWLAGGLNPENIVDAIKTVSPFGVDLCSGVRSDGKLDELKLAQFVNNINNI